MCHCSLFLVLAVVSVIGITYYNQIAGFLLEFQSPYFGDMYPLGMKQ